MEHKLISIHIPKTAGTSFGKTLKQVYKKREILNLYFYGDDRKKFSSIKIPDRIKVIHGHINLQEYKLLIENNPQWADVPIITWVRHPVKRFVSNYYYMRQMITDQLTMFRKRPGLKKRMLCSLEEVVGHPEEHNLLSRYINIDDVVGGKYLFIGNTENFSEDIVQVAERLGWKKFDIFISNKTEKKSDIDGETKAKIEQLSSRDMQLYNQIIEWKNSHPSNLSTDYSPRVRYRHTVDSKRKFKLMIRNFVGKYIAI